MRSFSFLYAFGLSVIAVLAAVGLSSRSLVAQQGDDLTYRITIPMVASDSATGEATTFAVYFFLDSLDEGEGPYLVPVHRQVPQTVAVATAALSELFAGPTAAEMASVPAISSTVPAGTQLLGVSIADGVATVDLSEEFESGGGSASVLGRLAQLVYTLTQFPTVDAVELLIEGEPASPFSSEGVIIDEPLTREDFLDFVPSIMVETPRYGGPATFMLVLVDNDGLILHEGPVTATCGTGCWGTFDVTIPYDVAEEQLGAIITWWASAQDGSQQDIREYPVVLTPAD
jgi:germination protein M